MLMRQFILCFVFSVSVCINGVLLAQAPESETGHAVQMFDGKSLDGWDADPKFWSIEDGAITGRTTAENPTKGNTFCIWKGGDASDFEMNFEFRIEAHNSGFQFRSFPLAGATDRWRLGGYQADFDKANRWSGTLFGERFRTILAKRGESAVINGAKMNKAQKTKTGRSKKSRSPRRRRQAG